MKTIKGLSLWNPYAAAMIAFCSTGNPLKTVETRNWSTNYRGPIAIQAAKRDTPDLKAAWLDAMKRPMDAEAFRSAGISSWDDMPFGCIIGVGTLVACIPTHDLMIDTARRMVRVLGNDQWEIEKDWGNFSPGRWLWHIEEMNVFPTPIPYRGAQGLFDVVGITI